MMGWETTNLSMLNDGRFEVSDPGPLHAPIGQFSIRRNDALKLILEIEGPGNATSRAIQYPAGTVRISAETVELVNVGGVKAVLSGVEPFSQSVTQAPHGSTLRELARVHEFTITTAEFNKAAYTIEWLENLPRSPFIWPDLIKTVMETNISHRFASTDDAITLLAPDRREMSDRCAAKLTVGGNTFFICALQPDAVNGGIRPGCIVYLGTPSDLARKQIRAGLSFALGSEQALFV